MSKKTTKKKKTTKTKDDKHLVKIQKNPAIAIYEARLWVSVKQYLSEECPEHHKEDMANWNSGVRDAIEGAFLNRYDMKLLDQDHRLINLSAFPPTWKDNHEY
jgi:hypothetical protein|tara:strand:- start:104 stop:412 length:309 start_codon:yes stop_codon:yes gene_type:complete